jgi:hypothetical protein
MHHTHIERLRDAWVVQWRTSEDNDFSAQIPIVASNFSCVISHFDKASIENEKTDLPY